MLAVTSAANDPVATPTPVANWPDHLTRAYRFPGVGPAGKIVSVSCALTKSAPTEITIIERTYDVTPIGEACRANGVRFNNTYMVDSKTGQVWKTRQWVGVDVGYLDIEVLEPFTVE